MQNSRNMIIRNKFISNYLVQAFVSGVLFSFAVLHVNFFLAWVCLIPLFIAIDQKSAKDFVWAGLSFGVAIPFVTFLPMINGVITFTGGGSISGLMVFLAALLISGLYWSTFMLLLSLFRFLYSSSLLLRALTISAAWALLEFILNLPLDGMPWFACHSGNALAENLYAIQTASLFGDHLMTLTMVAVNYLFSKLLLRPLSVKVALPIAVIAVWLVLGLMIEKTFESNNVLSQKPFKLAILSENISPVVKWNDQVGNQLVSNFLELNKTAVLQKPDIILWSESAIPWTYRPDDDFLREIRKISDSRKITHLIGINTDYNAKKLYNSVYVIPPGTDIHDRYDKCTALDIIEKPIAGFLFPFFNGNGFIIQEGNNGGPLKTNYGKAGVLICNESFLTTSSARMVANGAEFLINPANDGWFSETPAVRQHFFVARMRAVETRKDMVVNSNKGFSGLIEASGNIAMIRHSKEPSVDTVMVSSNSYTTLYMKYPFLWIFICIACLLMGAIYKLRTKDIIIKTNDYQSVIWY